MSGEKNGEVILISWDGLADFELVKGHIDDDEARETVGRHVGDGPFPDWRVERGWHRYVPDWTGEYDCRIVRESEPGKRGAFKTTKVHCYG